MDTAVIYATTHGTTRKAAGMIMQEMGDPDIALFELGKDKKPDLAMFGRIIIGGSIHAGRIQASVRNFCRQNMVELLQKEIGLFLCGMNVPEYKTQFENAFPQLLRSHAKSSRVVGGEFLFDKMNFFQKLIVRKVSGINQSVSRIDESAIGEFAREMVANSSCLR